MKTTQPLGYPHAGAGTVEILLREEDGVDYAVLFSPDPNNNELRENGQAMQFYYYPKAPRLAKHPDDRFKFSMQLFESTADSSTVIGAEGLEEEAGAYTTLTSTIDIPEAILKKAIDKLKERLQVEYKNNRNSKLFGLFHFDPNRDRDFDDTNVRPIRLVENNINMHIVGETGEKPFEGRNPWSFNVQGVGAGTTFGLGENAFSVLMGRNSASLVKSALENGNNNLVVENAIKYKGYLPTTTIKTTVKAKKIHTYFSAKATASYGPVSLNWESEYEKLKTEGNITSEIITDKQFSDEERQKVESNLLTEQRKYAFEFIKKLVFDKDKTFTPAKDPERKGLFNFFGFGGSVGLSLKSGKMEIQAELTDEIKFSSVEVLESKISGNLDPLTELSGDEAKEDLEKYITNVRLDEDFQKLQIVASLNGSLVKLGKENDIINDSPVSQVAIEVGYPDSKGRMVWKSASRMIAPEGKPYITKSSRSGKEIDAIFPSTWSDKSQEKNAFVFDFVKNDEPSNAKIKQTIMYEKDRRVNLQDAVHEYELDGTRIFIPLPIQNMINYNLSTEELFECDTLEVRIKVDKMPTKKFVFNADNYEEFIPLKSWYEAEYDIKPTKYKVKYTCKGKVDSRTKRVKVSTDWIELDYQEGSILLEIPNGSDEQNDTISAIRESYLTS